jgi:predicted AlkP superfamily phosphohydrolase/phosphomutase
MRLVVLFLDAAERTLVQRGIDEGWLPVLKELVSNGRSARIADDDGFFAAGRWPNTVTGSAPHEHLVIFNRQLRPGTYALENVEPEAMRRPPFWKFASDAGMRVIVANVYLTPIVRPFVGVQVRGWGTYEPYSSAPGREPESDPPEILALLDEIAPRRRRGFMGNWPTTDDEVRAYRNEIVTGLSHQARAIEMLMRRTQWDLFLGYFGELHQAGHVLWHLHDPAHPKHDRAASDDVKGAITDIYRAADAALGDIVASMPQDAALWIAAPDGMGVHNGTYLAMTPVLERGEWLARRSLLDAGTSRGLLLAHLARRAMHRVVPLSARKVLGRAAGATRRRLDAALELADVDWTTTRAFELPHEQSSCVRVNLEGREPAGIVSAGAYRGLCEDVAEALSGLVDADTREPAVAGVTVIEDRYGKPVGDVLPDVVVEWRERSSRRLYSSRLGTIDVPPVDRRTGQHRPDGWWIARGGGTGTARLNDERVGTIDVGPSVLSFMGVPVPDHMTGRPVPSFSDRRGAS